MENFMARLTAVTGSRHFPILSSLALIFTFMAGFYWRAPVQSALCSANEAEHCFREWISATGGWAAVFFAYLTITTMIKQASDANRHQMENVEIQIFTRVEDAKRLRMQSDLVSTMCQNTMRFMEKASETREFAMISLSTFGRAILEVIDDRDMMQMPYPTNKLNIKQFAEMCDKMGEELKSAVSEKNNNRIDIILASLHQQLAWISSAFDEASRTHQAFIEKWEQRIAPNLN